MKITDPEKRQELIDLLNEAADLKNQLWDKASEVERCMDASIDDFYESIQHYDEGDFTNDNLDEFLDNLELEENEDGDGDEEGN